MNMTEAVQYLRGDDPNLQVLGAAYIQHQCYNESTAKEEVRPTDPACGLNSSFLSAFLHREAQP